MRLGSRRAECVRLVLHDSDRHDGARGEARSQVAAGASGSGSVAEYDVLAPTEWNFHPRGPAALALAGMAPDGPDARVRVLAAAFDPCVPVRIGRGPQADAEDASCTR